MQFFEIFLLRLLKIIKSYLKLFDKGTLKGHKKAQYLIKYRGVEQLAARWAHNPKVASSSLAPATKTDIKELLPIFKVVSFYVQQENKVEIHLVFLHINSTQPYKEAVCCVDLFVKCSKHT